MPGKALSFADADDFEEALDLTPTDFGAATRLAPPVGKVADLSGMAKVLLLRGRARTGKTVLARYLAETVLGRGGEMVVAAWDQGGKRRLADFVDGVEQPPTAEPAGVARWAEKLFGYLMREKASALVDTGGGDGAMPALLKALPGLAEAMRAKGVAVVGVYTLGGDPLDLAVLAADVAAGLVLPETLIVLNHALVDATMAPGDAFRRTLGHPDYKAAVARGATVVEMQRLRSETAALVEGKKLHLRTGDGELPVFDGLALRQFVAAMDAEFEGVKSWLPS